MESLQYLIDTICARVTVEFMYGLIRSRLGQGAFKLDEILPAIQSKDRSLDSGSARQIAEAAVQELAQLGEVTVREEQVSPTR